MRLAIALVAFVVIHLLPTPALAAGYDVSYLWHRQLPSVELYRQKIAGILGPQVASKLVIVQKPGLYGLIYYRNGSSDGARKVARTHTRLLRSRGLEAAAPVQSRNWNLVAVRGNTTSPPLPTAKPVTPIGQIALAQIQDSSKVSNKVQNPVTNSPPTSQTSIASSPDASPATKSAPRITARQDSLTNLEVAVENHVKKLRARGVIASDERTAWSVYDFTTGEKLVDINEDVQFQAASLVKPFFAMAFFHKVKLGQLTYGSKSRYHMERMIQHSNNYSTNWILKRIGGPATVQRILSNSYGSIFQNVRIVEYIPSGGKTYRNKASVHDYSRFLYALWKDEIPGSSEIKRLMSLPGRDRLYTGANAIPKGTRVYNKTGSTARLCGDMGILVVRDKHGNSYPYTVIGVIEKRGRAQNYSSWIRSRGDVIRGISNIVYEGISKHHNLNS
ncbi:MAG: hypothetical protein DHS20C01_26370 [marine bacterium B5-7]|nr:MAG: hypothetical protein DHS20C01_26370 [marine bacterium B5-7]